MTFFFDHNISPKIASGLKAFGEDVTHLLDHLPPDTPDEEIFKFIFDNNMTLITRDKNIRYNEAERKAIHQYKVGVFFLSGKNMDAWKIIEQIVKNWTKIKELANKTNRPFAFTIRANGTKIERMSL